ncbi:hypothetical protein U1Q18_029238 [Sarracenia purpurea var. burkii]
MISNHFSNIDEEAKNIYNVGPFCKEKKKEGLCAKATRRIFADRRSGTDAQGRGAEGRCPWRRITGTAEKKTVSGGLREAEQAATRVFFISAAGGKIPNRAQWIVHWATKCPAEISGFVFRREEEGVAGLREVEQAAAVEDYGAVFSARIRGTTPVQLQRPSCPALPSALEQISGLVFLLVLQTVEEGAKKLQEAKEESGVFW